MTIDGAQPLETLPLPPEGWMDTASAARALGKVESTVRRWCGRGRLTARLCDTPQGPAWYIDPASKPSLMLACGRAEASPGLPGEPLLRLAAGKRADLVRKWEILAAWDQARDAERPPGYSVSAWRRLWCELFRHRNPALAISHMTLWTWEKERRGGGIASLVDGRGGFIAHEPDGYLWETFRGLVLGEDRQPVSQAYRIVAGQAVKLSLPWPTLRTVQRWYNERIAPIERAAGREVKRFEDRFVPYVVRDWTQIPAMGCWIADNRVLDLFYRYSRYDGKSGRTVWEKGRPWIQVWLDARSWYPAASEVYGDEPDAERTAELFAAGVSLHGAPDECLLDNGSGFRAEAFSGGRPNAAHDDDEAQVNPILSELGVRLVRFAKPWNHKAKPIEPFFSVVSREFDKLWSSYVGYSTSVRPGEADRIPVESLPTLDQVREMFGTWLHQTYARQPSPARAAQGLSPLRAFAELREPGREYAKPSDDVLCLLCMPSVPVRVSQNGIWVNRLQNWYWHEKLIERQGSGRDAKRKVSYRLLPGKPERIFVFDEVGRYFCDATPFAGGGMNPLIDGAKSPEDQRRLGNVLELRTAISNHYTATAASAREFAGNAMLFNQHESQHLLGVLDETALPPPAPKNIRFTGHEAGAGEMAREASGEARDERTSRQKAEEFLRIGNRGTGNGEQAEEETPPPPTQGELLDELTRRKGNDE